MGYEDQVREAEIASVKCEKYDNWEDFDQLETHTVNILFKGHFGDLRKSLEDSGYIARVSFNGLINSNNTLLLAKKEEQ